MISLERLYHFQCPECEKWWSIGDAPLDDKEYWFCPWCGMGSLFLEREVQDDINS